MDVKFPYSNLLGGTDPLKVRVHNRFLFKCKLLAEFQGLFHIFHGGSWVDQAHSQYYLSVEEGGYQEGFSGCHYFFRNVLVDLVQLFICVVLLYGVVPEVDHRQGGREDHLPTFASPEVGFRMFGQFDVIDNGIPELFEPKGL